MKNFLILVMLSTGLLSCKKAANNKARLRDESTVSVSANFKVVNSHMMIALNSSNSQGQGNTSTTKNSISDIRVSYVRSSNNNVDLAKLMTQAGAVPLTFVAKVNITATITNDKVTNANCTAENIQISATPVTANFSCGGSGGSGGGGGTPGSNGKYPPNVKDPAIQKIYDSLTVECQKSSANQLVTDGTNKTVVYGCYCSKIDRQLIFDSFKTTDTIETFKIECAGNKTTVAIALTNELSQCCPTPPGVPPMPNSDQPNLTPPSTSCTCLSKTNSQAVIKYSDFYAIYQPDAALKSKIVQVCK